MSIEGRLDIDLYCERRRVRHVAIRSSRPFQAVSVFNGRRVTEVLEMLPRLFGVCGTAQALAATLACEQALGADVAHVQQRARGMLVLAETVREHLWRVLLDWPAFAGREPASSSLACVTGLTGHLQSALYPDNNAFRLGGGALAVDHAALHTRLAEVQAVIETRVLDLGVDEWSAFADQASLLTWADTSDSIAASLVRKVADAGWSGFGRCEITALPALPPARLHDHLQAPSADTFVRRPQWDGRTHETTPLVRQRHAALIASLDRACGNGLLPRLVARLHELVVTLDELFLQAGELADDAGGRAPQRSTGTGLAQVEAARGRLIHRVEIDDNRVTRYQIVAPTEWNFHPEGVLAQGLAGGPADDGEHLQRRAALLVNAIDPCVDYRIRVH